MKKDLFWLNSKWWYRLIKVGYFILFLVVIFLSQSFLFSNFGPEIDYKKSYLKCDNGQKLFLEENNIFIFSRNIYGEVVKKNQQLCMDTVELGKEVKSIFNQYSDYSDYEIGVKVKENLSSKDVFSKPSPVVPYLDLGYDNYKLIIIKTNFFWVSRLLFPVLFLVGSIVIFELFRRIFYYVVLGSFLPEKPKRYLFIKTKFYKEKEQE